MKQGARFLVLSRRLAMVKITEVRYCNEKPFASIVSAHFCFSLFQNFFRFCNSGL